MTCTLKKKLIKVVSARNIYHGLVTENSANLMQSIFVSLRIC